MYDVAVIGYGPVGMVTAGLLGDAGYRVVVLERHAGLYNLPRAATFDDEIMRTFARLGISGEMLPKVRAQRKYEWRNGAGALLIEHDFADNGKSGWAEWYMMYQPDLEDALDRRCRALPSVAVRTGARVTAIDDDGSRVALTVDGDEVPVTSRYVVACDGGNSFTRRHLGIGEEDLGFSEPWMVCDFRLKGPAKLPMARQVCNPAQPESIISLGPGHHRFSFMLDSEDSFARESRPERIWGRVSEFISDDVAELIRIATYTFRSLVADRWRQGRVLLAGDAAHQMPPFLGQGMCSGIRDARNIAFKLDLVLSGRGDGSLLDTYQSEREPHVRTVINKGIELGSVQTMRDPAAAAARDAEYLARRRANRKPEKIELPGLGPGLVSSADTPGRGELMIQGRVTVGGVTARYDEHFGHGFHLVVGQDLRGAVTPEFRARAAKLDVAVHVVIPAAAQAGPAEVVDVDGTYEGWFAARSCCAALVRPDFYVYGTATHPAQLGDLLEDLGRALKTRAAR